MPRLHLRLPSSSYGSSVTELSIVAVDVGSLLNIGWWRELTESNLTSNGRDLDAVADAVVADLREEVPVALGFEAPLFVPRPSEHARLNKQRVGDKGRPWCAGAGTGALALGIQHATYVFERIAAQQQPRVTFDLDVLMKGDADLLVWEALVSGAAKNRAASNPHVDDARVAVREFARRIADDKVTSDIVEPDVLNLAAACLLGAGLTSDPGPLKQSCIGVKPEAGRRSQRRK